MERKGIFKKLVEIGVVPVVRADSAEETLSAIEALIAGGIPVVEITMTTPDAINLIRRCVNEYKDELIVGAGTVTDTVICSEAIEAGSQFVVTPTAQLEIVRSCHERDICIIGGALTPTEILSVWEAGADAVKVFPVTAVGGPDYIRMIHEPMPHIPINPTGGVTLETLEAYLKAGAAFVGAGGDLVGKDLLKSGNASQISLRASRYVSIVKHIRCPAVGVTQP